MIQPLLSQGLFYCLKFYSNLTLLETRQRYFLKKNDKLKSRKIIEQLFSEGKSVSVNPIRAVYFFSNSCNHLQTGFSVSSRHFKKAVDRNRIKRLMREAYRLQKNDLETSILENQRQLSLFLIYTGKELPSYQQIFNACSTILKRINKIVHEAN